MHRGSSPETLPVEGSGARPVVLQFISSLQVGGAERLLVDFLGSAAADPGARQVIAVLNDDVHDGLVGQVRASGFPLILMGRAPGGKYVRYLRELFRIIRRHNVEILHVHDDGVKFWGFVCKARFPRLKIVFTVHQNREFDRFQPIHRPLHRALVDRTIAISRSVLGECEELRIPNARLVYNGIPIERFMRARPGARPGPRIRLVNVARLDHRIKGQDVLIRAVRRCLDAGLDVECRLIGNASADEPHSMPRLQKLVSDLRLGDRVTFLQNRIDVPDLLREADIFVLASRREGFGLVVVEAMAAGLPVIVADIDGPAELVADGETGLRFVPGSDEDLAEKIQRLAVDPALAERLARNAAAFVQRFDIHFMRDRYFGIYEEVARGGHRREARADKTGGKNS